MPLSTTRRLHAQAQCFIYLISCERSQERKAGHASLFLRKASDDGFNPTSTQPEILTLPIEDRFRDRLLY